MIIQLQPSIGEDEIKEMMEVLKSTFITENSMTAKFEEMMRDFTGAKHCIAMSNGTVALYCAIKALNIGHGDEVIVPNVTFIASANAVIMAGATPIFCEVEPDTLQIDLAHAAKLVSKNTKAIMPVHLYGYSVDMDAVEKFATDHKLQVIEDAAEAIGVRYKGAHAGTLGAIGTLSFYGNKTLTCGEGGMVMTNDDELAKTLYRLKNHGRDVKGIYVHNHIGYNFSFTDMQAAIGVAQMKKLDRILNSRKQVYEQYKTAFASIAQIRPVKVVEGAEPAHWLSSFLVDDADSLEKWLTQQNIQSRRFFYPMHQQPCYEYMQLDNSQFKVSEQLFKQGITLPSSFLLTQQEQLQVIDVVKQFYGNRL